MTVQQIGLFEAMATMRAMRRLKPDAVPEALVWRIIEAATQAPSGGNRQNWHFVVVTEPDAKRFIQERYQTAFQQYFDAASKAIAEGGALPVSQEAFEKQMRMARAGFHLADHLHEAPVLLFACVDRSAVVHVGGSTGEISGLYASILPAVQNILLACRGLGLGAVLTTLHLMYEDEIKDRLGVPAPMHMAAMIPIGYPKGRFGPVTRRPPEEVTSWNRWGVRRQPAR